eukprot:g35776.t1
MGTEGFSSTGNHATRRLFRKADMMGNDTEQTARDKVAAEILQTEESYVNSLEALVEDYAIPLRNRPELLSNEEHQALFGKAPILLGLNKKFLTDLQEVMSKWKETPAENRILGEVFARFIPFFKMYSDYAVEYESLSALLDKIFKSSSKKVFKKWMETAPEDKSTMANRAQDALSQAAPTPKSVLLSSDPSAQQPLSPKPTISPKSTPDPSEGEKPAELAAEEGVDEAEAWDGPKPPPPPVEEGKEDAPASEVNEEQPPAEAGAAPSPNPTKFIPVRNRMQELPSLFIGPIQRIPRYQLLLQELLKRTPEDHPDHKMLTDSLDKVKEVAKHINETVRAGQSRQQILQLEEQFVKPPDFVAPSRFFIYSGKMVKKNQSNAGEETYTFHLFNDVLSYSTLTASNKFKLNAKVPVDAAFIVVDELPETDNKDHYYKITINNSVKTIVCYCKNAEDKAKWLEALNAAIENRDRSIKRQEIIFMAPTLETGLDASACKLCGNPFSILFRKRYNCANCGRAICEPCSSNRIGPKRRQGCAGSRSVSARWLGHSQGTSSPQEERSKEEQERAEARAKMDLSGFSVEDVAPASEDELPYAPKVPKRPPKPKLAALTTQHSRTPSSPTVVLARSSPAVPTRTRPVSVSTISSTPPSTSNAPSSAPSSPGGASLKGLLSSIPFIGKKEKTISSETPPDLPPREHTKSSDLGPPDLPPREHAKSDDLSKSKLFSRPLSSSGSSSAEIISSTSASTNSFLGRSQSSPVMSLSQKSSVPLSTSASDSKAGGAAPKSKVASMVQQRAKLDSETASNTDGNKFLATSDHSSISGNKFIKSDDHSSSGSNKFSKSDHHSSISGNKFIKSDQSSDNAGGNQFGVKLKSTKKLDSEIAKFGGQQTSGTAAAAAPKFCKHCGSKIKTTGTDPIKFCSNCGKKPS